MRTPINHPSDSSIILWLWLFPLSYLIHIAEEYWAGEGYSAYILRVRGVHLSTTRFLIAQGIGFVLVTIGVILARQFSFPRMMLVILGTTVLVNGITHTVTSLTFGGYGPGLFSSVFIWIPLGGVVLVRFWKQVTRKRYWVGLAIGVGINVLIGVITERGGRLI